MSAIEGNPDIHRRCAEGPRLTPSRHRCIAASYPSLDQLSGAGQHCRRDRVAKRFGGFEVDDELRRLVGREVGGRPYAMRIAARRRDRPRPIVPEQLSDGILSAEAAHRVRQVTCCGRLGLIC
jgi:hypothetical protein